MIRCAFNGGELSPTSAVRADLDNFHRGASKIENLDLGQMGGVSRRRGFRRVAAALEGSVILPYIYSTDDRYLVEVAPSLLRVLSVDGDVVASLPSVWTAADISQLRHKQVNSMLFLACPSHELMVLKRDDDGVFSLDPYEFKARPWRYEEYRDFPVRLTLDDGCYRISFGDHSEDSDAATNEGDVMRVQVTVPQQTGRIALDARGMRTVYLPAGARFDVNLGADIYNRGRGAVVKLTAYSAADVQYTTLWESKTDVYTTPSSGFYTFRITLNNGSTLEAAECQAELSGVASGVVKPEVQEDAPAPASVSTCDVLRFSLPLEPTAKAHFSKVGVPSIKALVMDQGRWTFQGSVLVDGDNLVIKPKGLTTDDLVKGQSVRVEWDVAAENFSIGANQQTGSRWVTRFLPAGTVVNLKGYIWMYAGQRNEQAAMVGKYLSWTPNSGSHSISTHTTLAGSWTVPEDGFYLIYLPFVNAFSSVIQWPAASAAIPACVGHLEGEVTDLTASAEYSLWDNVSTIPEGVPPSGESLMWSFAAFRDVYGFPSLVDVFQQRLVLAATQAQPQTVWLSKTDDLNNFEVGKQDDSALALTLSTTTQNRICWLMAQSSRLLLGTADAEWAVSGGQGVMTATNARADNHGFVGSSDVPAMMATDKVLYIERGGGRVYQYGYDYESDGYVSRDLTVFADHVLADGGGCRDIAFIRKPEPRAVFVRRDGQLALMTYNSMHQVNAWHRYTTDGAFEGVATLPNGDKADLLFALVTRDDGRFIEALAPDNEFQDPDGRDYVSSLETNALISLEAAGRRQHNSSVMFFFGSDALVSGIEVSIDGRLWDVPDRAPSSFLERGWHSLVADGCWNYDSMVGIRVSGNRDFNLLAIQA